MSKVEQGKLEASPERGKFVPQFSIAERDRRWRAVRDIMVFQNVDCLLLIGNDLNWDMGMVNFRYLTHISSKIGGYAVFPLEGEPTVFTGLPHMNRPLPIYLSTQEWVSDIRTNLGIMGAIEEIKARKLEKGRIGLVAFGMTIWNNSISSGDYKRIHDLLPDAEIVDFTANIDKLRLVKSDEEIRMLEKAGELANAMLVKMKESCKVGVTESEVWANMIHTNIVNGGEPVVFNLLSSGSTTPHPEEGVEHLLHGAEQPASPSMRPLKEDDLVITELHSSYAGYLAAAEYSVFLGKAPEPLRRIHEVAVECFHSGVEAMRPGVTVWELVEAFRAPCIRANMDWVELGFHGHGLASPEVPTVVYKPGEPIIAGDRIREMELKENMVFGTNIDVFDPNWRPDVGIMLGDMIHVTKDGPRPLCNTPLEFAEVAV